MGIFDFFKGKKTSLQEEMVECATEIVPNEVTLGSIIALDSQGQGRVHIFDLLPMKAREWREGSIFWRLETNNAMFRKCDLFRKVSEGEEIAKLDISYTKRKSNWTADVIEKISYPIISNKEGVVRFDIEWITCDKHNGKLNMDEASFWENHKDEDIYNPFLFSYASNVAEIARNEIIYSVDIDPITQESKIHGFEGNHYGLYALSKKIEYGLEGGRSCANLVLRLEPYGAVIKQVKGLNILFDSGEVLTFSIDKKFTSYVRSDWMETKLKLSQETINTFSSKKIKLVRYLFYNEGTADLPIEDIYAEYFQSCLSIFVIALKECGWQPCQQAQLEKENEGKRSELKDSICYVYLMYDEANSFYKIGISNKPEYREHTLQSEKPTIVLIKAKQFPVRPIAEAFEAALHKTYEAKRIRGEWFRLEAEDVENLKTALS